MIRLSGRIVPNRRAYALLKPEIPGEAPPDVIFGWDYDLARLVLGWKMHNWLPADATTWTDAQRDEASAMIEAIRDPQIDAWGYRIVEAQHKVVSEAAYTLDLEDLAIYYEGTSSDQYEIREWCAHNIHDTSVKHVLLDAMIEYDRRLTPDLVAQIHQQLDEVG